MTEIRGKIAERCAWGLTEPIMSAGQRADAIIAIPEIEEGQKLLEKAKRGKLVELDDAYFQDPKSGPIMVADKTVSTLKWVKPLASGESRRRDDER